MEFNTIQSAQAHFQQPLEKGLLKTVVKGENAGNQDFLLFPQFVLQDQRIITLHESH